MKDIPLIVKKGLNSCAQKTIDSIINFKYAYGYMPFHYNIDDFFLKIIKKEVKNKWQSQDKYIDYGLNSCRRYYKKYFKSNPDYYEFATQEATRLKVPQMPIPEAREFIEKNTNKHTRKLLIEELIEQDNLEILQIFGQSLKWENAISALKKPDILAYLITLDNIKSNLNALMTTAVILQENEKTLTSLIDYGASVIQLEKEKIKEGRALDDRFSFILDYEKAKLRQACLDSSLPIKQDKKNNIKI